MKRFLFIPFVIFWLNAFADCAGNGILVWPETNTINACQVFVIEGYFMDQQIIRDLNKKHPVYLRSGDQVIKLKLLELCEGEFRLTQAVLIPERELTIGGTYQLIVDSLPDGTRIGRWNTMNHQYTPLNWTVGSERDTIAPEWINTPVLLNKEIQHYGCGPAKYVNFSCLIKDNSFCFIKTTIRDFTTGVITSYYLKPDSTILKLGHGMCSGAFKRDINSNQEVEFEIIDASGNRRPWSGKPFQFRSLIPIKR